MSVSAYIDFKLEGVDFLMTPAAIFDRLIGHGWTAEDHGGVSYLPLGDTGQYDWQKKILTLDEIHQLLSEKYNAKEVAGVSLTIQPENIGGQLLMFEPKSLSLSLSINRRTLLQSGHTDFSWYIENVVPALDAGGAIQIISIVATEVE